MFYLSEVRVRARQIRPCVIGTVEKDLLHVSLTFFKTLYLNVNAVISEAIVYAAKSMYGYCGYSYSPDGVTSVMSPLNSGKKEHYRTI